MAGISVAGCTQAQAPRTWAIGPDLVLQGFADKVGHRSAAFGRHPPQPLEQMLGSHDRGALHDSIMSDLPSPGNVWPTSRATTSGVLLTSERRLLASQYCTSPAAGSFRLTNSQS